MNEGLKTLDTMKMIVIFKSVCLSVKSGGMIRVVVPTDTYGPETWSMGMDERHKIDILEMKFSRSMCRVIRMNQ